MMQFKRFGVLVLFLPIFSFAQVNEEPQEYDSLTFTNTKPRIMSDSATIQPLEQQTGKKTKKNREETDSLSEVKKRNHSPTRALWMSAVLPGLGQAYNGKYWKIPIVYAGFAGLGYAVYYTSTNYNLARAAYRAEVDEDPNTHGSYKGVSDAATLQSYRDYHRRNMTISSICMVVWYGLNLVDAVVDAHLYSFTVSDKLTMDWSPMLTPNIYGATAQMSGGLQLNFRF